MSVSPLSTDVPEETVPFDRRRFWRVVGGGIALLTIAGGSMWARFGSGIFFDMLASLRGCF